MGWCLLRLILITLFALMIPRWIRPDSAVQSRHINAMIVHFLAIAAFLTVAPTVATAHILLTVIPARTMMVAIAATIIAAVPVLTALTVAGFTRAARL